MIFVDTKLAGVALVDLDRREDERGFFARSFCQSEFEARGFNTRVVQCNVSYNETRDTLRGMHYQAKPYEEAKLVRCTRGAIYSVILDLRADSPTYLRWEAVELNQENRRMLYAPEGCALGYQTLADHTEVFYQMSEMYQPQYARGVRWNDPAFGIIWPREARIMSPRDRSYPDFSPDRPHHSG